MSAVEIGALMPEAEPLRSTFEALAEQYGILPGDITRLTVESTVEISGPIVQVGLLIRKRVTPEQLEERAARLLSAANRLRGIDTPPDAARSGTAYVAARYELIGGASNWVQAKCTECDRPWLLLAKDTPAVLAAHDKEAHA